MSFPLRACVFLPLWVGCSPREAGLRGTAAPPVGGVDSDSGLLSPVPSLEELSLLATAETPLLGGWREGTQVWLVGGSTRNAVEAMGRWQGSRGCLDLAPGGALWWVDGQPGGPIVAVGDGGRVVWLRGGPEAAEGPPTDADLYGVEVLPDGGLHVVGGTRDGRGEAWRWTPSQGWTPVLVGLDGVLFKVQDGFVVGEGWWGTWDPVEVGSALELSAWDWRGIVVQASDDGCGWMGGRKDGRPVLATQCAGVLSVLGGPEQGANLAGLATTPGGTLWAATGDGLPLWRSAAGRWLSPPHALVSELHGVVATEDGGALFLGGDLAGGSSGALLGFAAVPQPALLTGCPRGN